MSDSLKPQATGNHIGKVNQDKIFDAVNTVLMIFMLIVFVWPLLFVISASFSDPMAVWNGKVLLLPVGFNVEGYKTILKYESILIGYRNTVLYTVLGTMVNLVMTICAAYPLSRQDFVMKNFFTFMFLFTMYFSGGLIPVYLVVNKLGLINTIWAMIIPNAVSIFNVIIMRTYFQTNIPESLREAAELDGANTLQFLVRIVLPLSGPVLAVIGLYYAVGHWNDFFSALLYLNNKKLFPLQMFLRDILIDNTMDMDMTGLDTQEAERKMQLAQTMKYSLIIISSVPVLCIYPFIQKYFVKGIMIGAIKG